jgi:Ca2+/Na+ antiporter
MFNVLAGIGLPMLISTAKTGVPYNVGPLTPLVITSFVALLFPLLVTLIWVPLVGWRITHRIGRFLCVWFFTFIIIVLIVGFGGLSKGDVVTLGG